MQKNDRIYFTILTICFVLLISIDLINRPLQISPYKIISTFEKRKLAERPVIDLGKLDNYPSAYSDFFNDHFAFRSELIKKYTWFNYFILDKSPRPDYVTIGKNHWLYLVQKEKSLYNGEPLVSDSGIRRIAKYLEERTKWHEQRGIKFYFAIAPIKPEIYPEYNPTSFIRAKYTVTDKIISEIKKYPGIHFIELKPALLEAKKHKQIYCSKDNHWNSIGAFHAYKEIISYIRKDFPSIRDIDEKEIEFKDVVGYYGLTEVFNLGEELGDSGYAPVIQKGLAKKTVDEVYFVEPPEGCWKTETVTGDSTRPKALVFRDSFTTAMMPFLNESFARTTYIFDKWNYDYHKDVVEKEKPDLVILLIYESYLNNLADGN